MVEKYKIPNTIQTGKKIRAIEFDLEDRTFVFAKDVRAIAKRIPKTPANVEDTKQVIRA